MRTLRHRKQRGLLLLTSLIVAFIMMLWVVAAVQRTNMHSGSVLYSHNKSQSYYLAKAAVSRSLYLINQNPSWATTHVDRDTADGTTQGALSWVETVDSTLVLRCEAEVGAQRTVLSVPLRRLDSTDTHIYSIMPALGGGPDVIAWTTVTDENWEPLPPIPNAPSVTAVAGSADGDVFAVAGSGGGSNALWRYRVGRGWIRMPDLPSGVSLESITVSGSSRLVGLGSNDRMLVLPLDSSLNWQEISPPGGTSLSEVTIPPDSVDYAYATGLSGGQPSLHQYNFTNNTWSDIPAPPLARFNPSTGGLISLTGTTPDMSGGVAVDSEGDIFVATNPSGELSSIHHYQVDTPGSTSGTWRTLPPVPTFGWQSDSAVVATGFSTELRDLRVDDEGYLWVQWQSPSSNDFATIQIDPEAE